MKLVRSNGRRLTVRDVGPIVITLEADGVPLPIVDSIEEDDAARDRLRDLLGSRFYRKVKE